MRERERARPPEAFPRGDVLRVAVIVTRSHFDRYMRFKRERMGTVRRHRAARLARAAH
jgi:hypothetical protein